MSNEFQESVKPSREVIAWRDTGYIRSNPEKIGGLLRNTLIDGKIAMDDDILKRVIDLSVNRGTTMMTRDRSKNEISRDKFNSRVRIVFEEIPGIRRKYLDVSVKGNHEPSSSQGEVSWTSPEGVKLYEPRVDISFNNEEFIDDTNEIFNFKYGKGGETYYEHCKRYRSTDERKPMTSEEANEYLYKYFPTSEKFEKLNKNNRNMWLGEDVSNFIKDVRNTGREMGMKESVLYVPPDYFSENNREGEFFSLKYPAEMVPSDIAGSDSDIINKIKNEMRIDLDEATESGIKKFLPSLKFIYGEAAVMVEDPKDGRGKPEIVTVPTIMHERVVRHLLQNIEQTKQTLEAFKSMQKQTGREKVFFTINPTVKAGVLGKDYKKYFEAFTIPGENERTDEAVSSVNKAYDALFNMGESMRKSNVFLEKEIEMLS